MAESGGPIFEGSSKPFKEKLSATADHVRERVVNRLKQNTGMDVEQKWMNAYQRTTDALNPGMRKKIMETMRLPAVAASKLIRLVAGYKDISQLVHGLGGGLGSVSEIVAPSKFQKARGFEGKSIKDMRLQGAAGLGKGIFDVALGGARIRRVAAGWLADVAGAGGEKIAQITNKIFSGKPKPMAA